MSDGTYNVSQLGAEPDEYFTPARRVMRYSSADGLVFEWEGGEYIDVRWMGAEYAHDCINTSRPDGTFPEFTKENMMQEIGEWYDGDD